MSLSNKDKQMAAECGDNECSNITASYGGISCTDGPEKSVTTWNAIIG